MSTKENSQHPRKAIPRYYELKGDRFIGEYAEIHEQRYQEKKRELSLRTPPCDITRYTWYEANVAGTHEAFAKAAPIERLAAQAGVMSNDTENS